MPHPFTKKQSKSFDRGKWLIETYKMISPEHQDPTTNKSVIVGDMIADLYYTMTRCYQYPKGDINSVKIVALNSIEFDHAEKKEKTEPPPAWVVGMGYDFRK
jgi:hypothetical protein